MLIDKVLFKQYKIIEEIGSGAFGKTYIAIDTAFPGSPRRVVKHLCPKNSDPESLAIAKRLFKTEAKVLSHLGEHDRIPRLFSYFEEEGEFFLVQELVEGQDLTQEFQPGKRWSEVETIRFLQELLEILSVVHQENTIHRDLKPANIMRRQRDGKLVLIDFGLVKEILNVDRQETKAVSLSVGVGTHFYMPPEQAIGRPGKYSDVYAVGILGIQALTGLPPSREIPQDSEQLKQMWNDLNIEVSPQLKYVLERMVNFQYKQRFPDAVEALKALIVTEIKPLETHLITSDTKTSKSPKLNQLVTDAFKWIHSCFATIITIVPSSFTPEVIEYHNPKQIDSTIPLTNQSRFWQKLRLLLLIALSISAVSVISIILVKKIGLKYAPSIPINGKIVQDTLDGKNTCQALILGQDFACKEYNFSSKAGQQVTIEMNSEDFDPYLVLLAPDGNKLAVNGDISPQNWNAKIAFDLTSNGNYLVMARVSAAGETGNYSIKIIVK
ncbi:putative Calcium/calmodulin-dependent protein kinase [Hyella patelloides LEGE 07179]|uniref:non-specific serine/threonine protein kinase n=1 Tax=Hyella patelloides LEGE 07179 TaxID=945734 RepID=A0A563VNY1_9CYAN|nr:protein kinase [Hyella patelloides]VEP13130.1 putative Calcium/calmodulin-dependent protein kinase [Hyella patelloides LEGE 07179]